MKIDLEIAEIIEVKVGNHHLEIDILLLGNPSKKKKKKWGKFHIGADPPPMTEIGENFQKKKN